MVDFLTIDKATQLESNTFALDNELELQGGDGEEKKIRTTAVMIPHGPYFVVN